MWENEGNVMCEKWYNEREPNNYCSIIFHTKQYHHHNNKIAKHFSVSKSKSNALFQNYKTVVSNSKTIHYVFLNYIHRIHLINDFPKKYSNNYDITHSAHSMAKTT
jgi:hypothetical protein